MWSVKCLKSFLVILAKYFSYSKSAVNGLKSFNIAPIAAEKNAERNKYVYRQKIAFDH